MFFDSFSHWLCFLFYRNGMRKLEKSNAWRKVDWKIQSVLESGRFQLIESCLSGMFEAPRENPWIDLNNGQKRTREWPQESVIFYHFMSGQKLTQINWPFWFQKIILPTRSLLFLLESDIYFMWHDYISNKT